MGADLCSTLRGRADDLCPGLTLVLGVGAEGATPSRHGGPGILPPGKFEYST